MSTSPRSYLLAALGVAAAAGLLVVAPLHADSKASKDRELPELKVERSAAKRDAAAPRSYAPVVKKAAPSVVYVFSSKTVKNPHPELMPFFNDPLFRRFFGDQVPDNDDDNSAPQQRRFGQRRQPEMKQQGLGSGVIVSADGYILTNNHVIDGADEVKVGLDAGGKRELVAEVVGRDPKTDLAVLKIDAKDLTPITIADSDALEVGDTVLAIGNPFGIGQTVTSGIVSATGRGGLGIEEYEDFIQTDAAINPGNSGGALVDTEGRLVGINTAIYSRTGGFMGLGFAIPSNLARAVMEQLITKGKIERGYIGVGIQDITEDLKKGFGVDEGVIVNGTSPGSAGEKAGIKQGDVIVKLDGQPVVDARRLRLMVGRYTPGTEVKLEVIRDGKPQTFTLKLGEQPREDGQLGDAEKGSRGSESAEDTLNGVGVADITPQLRDQLDLPRDQKGAVITDVDPDSAAGKAGLREGDVIIEINKKPVENAQQAVELTTKPATKRTLVLVLRGKARLYIMVDETKSEKK
ncbi:MAG TPA: DegQ family serine endoprotease [Opitutaceae bacterium]|nr:DegQ family serine endoprotease [Opitutaceae bacterium]